VLLLLLLLKGGLVCPSVEPHAHLAAAWLLLLLLLLLEG
jgi:hypothetical protein